MSETKFLEKLDTKYIVEYITSGMESDNCLCIQMEFCEYDMETIIKLKNLLPDSLNNINYYISCELLREILECVQYLHSCDPPIIHIDLKPANILINSEPKNGRFVKLCDFGTAMEDKMQSITCRKSLQCTVKYVGPELLNGKITTKADIYSIGMIAFELFDEMYEY